MEIVSKAIVEVVYAKDLIVGKTIKGKKRSCLWRKIRKEYLVGHGFCVSCGSTSSLEVHHIKSFHDFPEFELVPSNLMTLCSKGRYGIRDCHLLFGHNGDWMRINEKVMGDINEWRRRIGKESVRF